VLFLSLIFCKQEEKLLFFGSVSGGTYLILYSFNCSLIDDRSLFGLYFNKNYYYYYLHVFFCISITSSFYLISFTSEDKYMQWPKAEELKNELFLYVKTLRFTIGIINKNWIIPTEYLRPTSFGLNDIDNIDEVVKVNFGLLSKKAKRWLKLFELDYWKSEGNITHFCFSIKVSRVWSYKVVSVWRKGGMGIRTFVYYWWTPVLLPKTVKLSWIVQITKYFQFLFRTI
jgi:hypothetical protein